MDKYVYVVNEWPHMKPLCRTWDYPNGMGSADNSVHNICLARLSALTLWHCWWLKTCTTWDVWDLVDNGICYHMSWCRISSINSMNQGTHPKSRHTFDFWWSWCQDCQYSRRLDAINQTAVDKLSEVSSYWASSILKTKQLIWESSNLPLAVCTHHGCGEEWFCNSDIYPAGL